jgi:cellulose synthase/poly-beta-1,6-N-acetylglucosamine synthase-like glycosyltransferase
MTLGRIKKFKYKTEVALIFFSIAMYFTTIMQNVVWETLLWLTATLLSTLYYIYKTSLKSFGKRRQKLIYTISFIGLSAVFTIINNYILLLAFEASISAKIFMFILTPLTFQMYYKIILCTQYLFFKPPQPETCTNIDALPGCSMILATRNEPFDVCKMTFDSANSLNYPADKKEIIIVDNSDLSHKDLTKWKNYVEKHVKLNNGTIYRFIHRNSTIGFKPKNLDIGMTHVSKPYVMLLDADSTLMPNTLKQVMPEFAADPKLGFASLLIKGTNNASSFFAKIGCISQNMLRYTMGLIGQNGFVIFQGHNSVWSKETLRAIGPWLETHRGEPMIVEDVAAAVRCYFKGHYGRTVWLDSGEWVPTSMKECESMWMRWTYGNMQITHKYFWSIVKSNMITFKEKTDILNQMFSFSVVLTPVFAFLGILLPHTSPIWLAYIILLNAPAILSMIGYGMKNKSQGSSKIRWLLQLYLAFFVMNSFITWVSAKAVVNYLLRRDQGWKPTGKTAESRVNWMSAIRAYKGMMGFGITGITCAILMDIYLVPGALVATIVLFISALFFVNLILNIMFFGRSVMSATGNLETLSIHQLSHLPESHLS